MALGTVVTVTQQQPDTQLKQLPIDATTGDQIIVAAAAVTGGKVVRVWRYKLFVRGGADVDFMSVASGGAQTSQSGGLGFGTGTTGIIEDGPTGYWLFQCLPNEGLTLHLSSSQRISGTILYSIDTPNP